MIFNTEMESTSYLKQVKNCIEWIGFLELELTVLRVYSKKELKVISLKKTKMVESN